MAIRLHFTAAARSARRRTAGLAWKTPPLRDFWFAASSSCSTLLTRVSAGSTSGAD